ncbi:SAM-dependent methyltransferase [Massilia sp. W12]|uniref:SAM-dependent methyltransferase n=1 Tax=Massilia sp. W12 TaxID=3126507 RepID=UPI0030CB4654
MLIITIKQGKEKRLLAGDPLIYATAIEKVEGTPKERNTPGSTALVQTSARQFLARAAYNAKSQVAAARVWTLREDEPIDHAMIKRRVQAAFSKRAAALQAADPQDLFLLIDGEQEGLPGLLVQSYGGPDGYLVCQFNAAGVELWKVAIAQALIKATQCNNVYQRGDTPMRKSEGLPPIQRALAGDEPPQRLMVRDGGRLRPMDIRTGFHYPK